jgi:hypothetical protein
MVRFSTLTHALAIAIMIILGPALSWAQGSIYGAVTASDGSTPDSGQLAFFGYLNNTDEEIRIETSTGAGYDSGQWYDDFQNFMSEAPGLPYDYHFYDASRSEGFILSSLIPDNSFQEEDVALAPVSWPSPPAEVTGRAVDPGRVEIRWLSESGMTYHIYRRVQPSAGSFFRIDDPTGSLSNPGIADSVFADTTVDSGLVYDYVIIAEDNAGRLGPHSDVVTVEATIGSFLRGDANADGTINIGDAVFLVEYIFKDGPPPDPLESGETNCDGWLNIGDITFIIAYLFRDGPPPNCP